MKLNPLKNKIVLLNAPKGAGKDTIGVSLKNLHGCEVRAFKTALYECSFPFTRCTSWRQFIMYCTDRNLKEEPNRFFYGMSPRQFLIHISEDVTKPRFGEEFFGLKSAESISVGDFERGVVFTDSGFAEEVRPLVKEFGGDNVYVVQFTGQGSDNFDGDSRTFFEVKGARTIKMEQTNDIIPETFARLIVKEIEKYA